MSRSTTSSTSPTSRRPCAPRPPSTPSNARAIERLCRFVQDDTMPLSPPLRLGVNIDHVATVRNARGGKLPDPMRAASIAAKAGADGITAHLREDRRHIVGADIEGLMHELKIPLN